jgi:cytoskeleton protein RodZ
MPAQRGSGDFGGTLRAARERRGLSLRQIANATKISIQTLEALEKNDIARLPGGIFSRAFVRSYALEVGLDPETAIQEFMGQFPHDSVTAGHPASSQVEDHEAVESDRKMASTVVRLIAISVPIAAVVMYFGTAGRPITQTVEAPSETAAAAPPSVPPQATELAAVPAAINGAPGDRPAAAAIPADRLIVQVLATRRAWVAATVDGRRAVQKEFQPGEAQTFEVIKEIVLTTGDSGGVNLTVNGMPAKPLGANGQVVTTRLNLQNFKEYLLTP